MKAVNVFLFLRDDPSIRSLTIHPAIAKLVGGINEAVFLENIIQWLPRDNRGKEIYKTADDIERETTLTKKQQILARKNLCKLRVIKERRDRWEHRLYYSLDLDGIESLLSTLDLSEVTKGNLVSDERELSKGTFGNFDIEQGSKQENTSKNTKTIPNPNIKVFIDWWCERHQQIIGQKYLVQGGRDGKAVKTLLSNYPMDKVKTVAENLLKTKEDWYVNKIGRTLSTLLSQWNKLSTQGVKAQDEVTPSVPRW